MKRKAAQDAPVLYHPYESIARRLHILKYILIFVLIAFLLTGLFVWREDFTAENLRFLVRDLSVVSPSLGLDSSEINFDYDTSQRAALYHGDLVLLKRSLLEVYSFSGSRSLSQEVAFSSPALITGDKYLLAYDLGGARLSVCNSFSELYTESFPYKIDCADLADDGTFAVVTAEKGYHSVLYVYNSDFERIYRYATAERVVYDVSLCREDPHYAALACVRAEDGDFLTELLLFDTRRGEVLRTYSFPSEMPLQLSFPTPDTALLLTDRGLHRAEVKKDAESVSAFEPEELSSFYSCEGYDILLKNSGIIGTTLDAVIFPQDDPENPITFSLPSQVLDLFVQKEKVYLLSYDALNVYSLSDGTLKTHKLESEYKRILPLSGGRIAFVGEGSVAIYMVG